jgi:hypothetical protein
VLKGLGYFIQKAMVTCSHELLWRSMRSAQYNTLTIKESSTAVCNAEETKSDLTGTNQ